MKVQALPQAGTSMRAHAEWLRLTMIAALLATGLDAFLLERSKGFFTGGFLAEDHVRSPLEGLVFVGASLLADAALLGVLVAVGLWALGRLRLTSTARAAASTGAAWTPSRRPPSSRRSFTASSRRTPPSGWIRSAAAAS